MRVRLLGRCEIVGVVAAAAVLVAAATGSAHNASVCGSDGVDTAAVTKAYAVIADVVQDDNGAYCELETKYGDVNIAPEPTSEAATVVAEFKDTDAHFHTQALPGMGKGALLLWGPVTAPEQDTWVAFTKRAHFYILSTQDAPLHDKLVALARVVYAHVA